MKQLIGRFTTLCEKFLPDALGFCLILTALVFAAACVLSPHSPLSIIGFWGDSLWSLNAFAFQMSFVLLSGHMLAQAPLVARRLNALARLPSSPGQALILLSVVSLIACWLNWGFGLIVAALFARALAQRFPQTSYGLMLATGYSGFIIWHAGLSASIPLSIAGQDKILLSLNFNSIPLGETIFSPATLILCALLLILFPLTAYLMRDSGVISAPPFEMDSPVTKTRGVGFKGWVEHSRVPLLFFVILAFLYLINLMRSGKSPDINFINLLFFMLSALLLGSVNRFLNALSEAVKNVGGILIQYPLYAGIMGIIQGSGLGEMISFQFANLASASTFPLLTFWCAGLVNFFVPSGGGQWVVQGPVMMKAAQELGVPISKTAMSIAWGDAWTNLVQPFWAIPLLSMAKLQLKDIMGPCLIYFALSGVLLSLGIYFL
ncbi:MAG: TIGR00366 family protein [Bacteriovoracaceae bacterium]|nr:TIGR00366 family protein [Bacteriovoracaceae bacterium]